MNKQSFFLLFLFFFKNQISILELFLKDRVALKNDVMKSSFRNKSHFKLHT